MRDLQKLTDFVTVPTAIAVLFVAAPSINRPAVFVLGFVAWTLLEYGVHRLLHVRRFRAAHMRHHQHPRELVGGTAYTTAALVVMVAIGACAPLLAPGLQGLLAGYFVFMTLHAINHHAPRLARWLPGAMRLHDRHHHGPADRCFGVTTAAWDRLFGTL